MKSSAPKTSLSKYPRPLSKLSKSAAKKVRHLFFDIDDTVTLDGKIPAEALNALWAAKKNGWTVVPVTGRPAGWVDHIARMWPVDAVVGENGGFYFHVVPGGRDGKLVRRFIQSKSERAHNSKKLRELFESLRKDLPRLQLAGDQAYRAIDLAIDICEEVTALSKDEVSQVVETFRSAGAQSKVSSIHVNSWFGTHDKLTTCKLYLQEILGLDFDSIRDRIVYLGDSPNDEPMFAEVPLSIGVANVAEFLPQMKSPPKYLCRKPGGLGFAEAIRILRKLS